MPCSVKLLNNYVTFGFWSEPFSAIDFNTCWLTPAKGQFDTILGWMREHVHQYDSKFEPQEIMQKATGSKITHEPHMAYLKTKYGEIYGL